MLLERKSSPFDVVDATDEIVERPRQAPAYVLDGHKRLIKPREARRAQPKHVNGVRQPLQMVGAEVDQLHTGGRPEHPGSGGRHDDLSAVRRAHKSRSTVQRRAEIVAVTLVGLTRVHPHTHPYHQRARPRLT